MVAMLVCARDVIDKDPYLNTKIMKRGDVICAMPDDHEWGGEELKAPYWRILIAPALKIESVQPLLHSEVPTDPEAYTLDGTLREPNTWQFRAFFLDDSLADIPAELVAYLADDNRKEPTFIVPPGITLAAVINQRKPVPDPAK